MTSPKLEMFAAAAVRPAPLFSVGQRVARVHRPHEGVWQVAAVTWKSWGWCVAAEQIGMTLSAPDSDFRRATPADEARRPERMSARQVHEATYDGWLPPFPREAEGETV